MLSPGGYDGILCNLESSDAGISCNAVYVLGDGAWCGTHFFMRTINQKLLDGMRGMAAGVMIAASFWSLLAPAIEMSEQMGGLPKWFPATVGFLCGGAFLWVADKILPHLHPGLRDEEAEGIHTSWPQCTLLV